MEITSGKWDEKNSAYAGYAYDVVEEDDDNYFLFYSNNKKADGTPSLCGKLYLSVKNYNTGAKITDEQISEAFTSAFADKMFAYAKGEISFDEIFDDLNSMPNEFFTPDALRAGKMLRINLRAGNATYPQEIYDRADDAFKKYATYVSEIHNVTYPEDNELSPADMKFLSASSHLHKDNPYISF